MIDLCHDLIVNRIIRINTSHDKHIILLYTFVARVYESTAAVSRHR